MGRRLQLPNIFCEETLFSRMTVDNYARKLFEYEGMKDMKVKGLEQQKRNHLNAILRTRAGLILKVLLKK